MATGAAVLDHEREQSACADMAVTNGYSATHGSILALAPGLLLGLFVADWLRPR